MDSKKLISELSIFKKTKSLSNSQIETEIGLPKNSLSNFLSFKKELPQKWNEPILKYISNSNIVINTLGDLKDKVTTADKIVNDSEVIQSHLPATFILPTWYRLVIEYCEKESITPGDLILSHQERNKPQKSKKGSKSSKETENAASEPANEEIGQNKFSLNLRKAKCGF